MNDYLEDLLCSNEQGVYEDWDADGQDMEIHEEDDLDECETF
ncbi:hypothetical protein [Teredinibacter haidensis]|nr:hypothetical protein [Teredinibacter haidensis]